VGVVLRARGSCLARFIGKRVEVRIDGAMITTSLNTGERLSGGSETALEDMLNHLYSKTYLSPKTSTCVS